MDNKYYTPSIKEFHIGFEFELLQMGESGKYTNEYCETIIDDSMDFNNVWDIFNSKRETNIRVKYLDKEDIESLSWHLDPKISILDGPIPYYIFDKEGYEIDLFMYEDPNKRLLRVYKIVKDDLGLEYARHLRFSGNIRNKSELKVLLKQLKLNNK